MHAGIGIAPLPCYLGDRKPGLRRIGPIQEVRPTLRLLTHQDLRRTARVRAFLGERDLLEGRRA